MDRHSSRIPRTRLSSSMSVTLTMAMALTVGLLTAPLSMTSSLASLASAAVAPTGTIIDSPVNEVFDATVGPDGTIYAVGDFTQVGAATGGLARLDGTSAEVDRSFPSVNGYVNAVIADATGALYLGGHFIAVGGQPRSGLARLHPDGSLDATWAPRIGERDSYVTSLALDGTTLYIGGNFTTVNGESRRNLAAIDTVTAQADAWTADANFPVVTLASDDTHLYAGGYFTTIDSVTRRGLAAFDLADGSLDAGWDPGTDYGVSTLTTHDGLVYAGGEFTTIAGVTRNKVAALDADTGAATSWDPFVNGSVASISIDDTTAYIGGNFSQVNGSVTRNRVAALRTDDTGTALAWNPDLGLSANVTALLPSGSDVYIGGFFYTLGGSPWRNLARVDATVGTLDTSWDPGVPTRSGSQIYALLAQGSSIIAGGSFSHLNAVTRNSAAAFDTSMRVTSWDPNISDNAYGIAISGSTAYIVGAFSTVNGTVTREHAAAFRTDDTGTLTSWDPDPDDYAYDIVIDGSVAYFVGEFTRVGASQRNHATSVRIDDTGSVTSWDPDLDGTAYNLALDGTTAYMVGGFNSVNGGTVTRDYVVAVRTDDTGTATDWYPQLDSNPYDVAVHDGLVYLVGTFQQVNVGAGTVQRYRAASFSADDTGTLTEWDPDLDGDAYDIQISGSYAYLGGDFRAVNGGAAARAGLAAISIDDTGTASDDWVPIAFQGFNYDGQPNEGRLNLAGQRILVSGSFPMATFDGRDYAGGLAALPIIPSEPTPTPTPPTPTAPTAPRDVVAQPGDTRIEVTWQAPAQAGSFAVTNYRVVAQPGGRTCLTSSLGCTLTGLRNGAEYSITVSALSGAGWGAASTPVTVTPRAKATIVISGSRDGRTIRISGTATGLASGVALTPWLRLSGQEEFVAGSVRIRPQADGSFIWKRRTSRAATVYVATPDDLVQSNEVTLPRR